MATLTRSKCPHYHEAPSLYIPRDKNIIYHIFHDYFESFIDHCEENYAKDYVVYRLDRITGVVNKFLECGDYTQALARIVCTNPNCDYEYFRPFSCKSFGFCPSCTQKRSLLFGEYLKDELLLKLPHRHILLCHKYLFF